MRGSWGTRWSLRLPRTNVKSSTHTYMRCGRTLPVHPLWLVNASTGQSNFLPVSHSPISEATTLWGLHTQQPDHPPRVCHRLSLALPHFSHSLRLLRLSGIEVPPDLNYRRLGLFVEGVSRRDRRLGGTWSSRVFPLPTARHNALPLVKFAPLSVPILHRARAS